MRQQSSGGVIHLQVTMALTWHRGHSSCFSKANKHKKDVNTFTIHIKNSIALIPAVHEDVCVKDVIEHPEVDDINGDPVINESMVSKLPERRHRRQGVRK